VVLHPNRPPKLRPNRGQDFKQEHPNSRITLAHADKIAHN
jgi:uncharacterized protein (DUF433 family)/predicted nuclease of predicted toxin-antitoxin system